MRPHRNWQDWGLHNARRTAFHAAVNYYCRQLGIFNYSPSQPIQWTKSHELSNFQDEEDYMDPSFDPEDASPLPAHQQLPQQQQQVSLILVKHVRNLIACRSRTDRAHTSSHRPVFLLAQ